MIMLKKIIVLAFAFIFSMASAESINFDLSVMSFDELIELQEKVNLEIFSRDKWKEVKVPMGAWDVGKDIPAGRWEITQASYENKYSTTRVVYYLERHTDGSPNKIRGQYALKNGEPLVIELFEGNVIKIEDSSVIFKPYIASFSFD